MAGAEPALDRLYGSCACERNQYTVVVPQQQSSLAQVFFDNSIANRRPLASPITAWLRVPLDWYTSTTFAFFPDETHASIKRTFYTHAISTPRSPPTRRQFCGYCGTHLTAWSEDDTTTQKGQTAADFVDITLGSLLGESLHQLETLRIIPDVESGDENAQEHDSKDAEDTSQISGRESLPAPDEEINIPTNVHSISGVNAPYRTRASISPARLNARALHKMQGRGVPYFEELIENSPLGRFKRQRAGQTSRDGTSTVRWEVLEISSGDTNDMMVDDAPAEPEQIGVAGYKRPRVDS